MAKSTTVSKPTGTLLGLGGEFLMLGLAVGVASISDETGSMMIVFMMGLGLIWIIHHTAITNAIPVILSQGGFKGG